MKRRYLVLLGAAPLCALAIGAAVAHAHTAVDAPLLATPAPAPVANDARPVLLTGEVEALDSQNVVVPPSNNSPVVLRNFVAEGSPVKAGDVVLRIELAEAGNIDSLKADLARTRARADSETAKLEVTALDAEKALVSAKAALDKAKVDAALPKA